jgi:hypothetical protein
MLLCSSFATPNSGSWIIFLVARSVTKTPSLSYQEHPPFVSSNNYLPVFSVARYDFRSCPFHVVFYFLFFIF